MRGFYLHFHTRFLAWFLVKHYDNLDFKNIFITVIFEIMNVDHGITDWLCLGIKYLVNYAHICSFKMFS